MVSVEVYCIWEVIDIGQLQLSHDGQGEETIRNAT